MNPIRMVDLQGQYARLKSQIDRSIQEVIDSTAFIRGRDVQLFEEELAAYLGVGHVVACANGTDALQVAMMALDLRPGDEVIGPDFTFIATNEAAALLGLKPVLVDVKPDSFCMDPISIRKAITPRTRAIVPVHLFGQCADMEEILAIAREHNLYVIEDNAQALGATYRFADGRTAKAGTMGTVGCTSFFPSKNLGCYGDGGALFTNNDALARRLRMATNHGMKVRYYHDSIGVNSRLDTIQAAVLRVKLPHLDGFNQARQQAAHFYDAAFANHPHLTIPVRNPASDHIFHQYTLLLTGVNRDLFLAGLEEAGIPAMVYYPVPMHRQKAYSDPAARDSDFPVSNDLCQRVVSIPMHTELDEEQLKYIANHVLKCAKPTP